MLKTNKRCVIISIPCPKGGLGKSLIHTQMSLAVAIFNKGLRVTLFDADPQSTSIEFFNDRIINKLPALPNLNIVKKQSDSSFLQDIIDASYNSDFIFIDTAGADTMDLTKVQFISDIAYHVCDVSKASTYKSKEFELAILADNENRKLLGNSESCVYKTFYNGVSPIPNVAKNQLNKCKKPVDDLIATGMIKQCEFNISRREPFTECMNTGASIFELDTSNKVMSYYNAKVEIQKLYLDIMNNRHNIIKIRG